MTIDALTATGGTGTTPAPSNQLQGSKDEFLKLFMAQLQNQDPLDPKNGADMVAQLAQFSSVEQATETNQHLADLVAAQSSTSSASLSSLVGRDCNASASDFKLDRPGSVPPLQLDSTSPMKGATVVITDDSGKEIRRIPVPAGATTATIAWDGKTSSGATAPAGNYHVAVDAGTSNATITSQWHGRVDAVELTPDGPRLRMGGLLLPPAAITTIGAESPITTIANAGVHV